MSDIRGLLHGMQREVEPGVNAPAELRTRIHRAAGRRRATREVAGGSLAVVAAGALAFGVVRIGTGGEGDPAGPSPSSSPTAAASVTPTPEPSASPAPTQNFEVGAFPWDTYTRPQLVPATQAAADATLDPTDGPTISIGVLEPSSYFSGWGDVDCAVSGDGCGRIAAPPATREVLATVTPAWEVVTDLAFWKGAPGDSLGALYLASPQGDLYTLLDTAALTHQLGLGETETTDVALNARAGSMIVTELEFDGNVEHVVFVDLHTGHTVLLFESREGRPSVERDGDNWLLWGTNSDAAPFAARLAPDAQSWDVDGMWSVSDGTVERAGGHLVVRSGDGFLLAPQPDLSLINITAPATEGEQCSVAGASDVGLLRYCGSDSGEAQSPQLVGWDGAVADAPEAPSLPAVPLQRWAFSLGDGIIEITPSLAGDNAEVPAGTPPYEWHRPSGTESIDGPLSGSATPSREDGAAVWLRQDLGMSVIDSTGTWHHLVDWPATQDHGYGHQPRFLDTGS